MEIVIAIIVIGVIGIALFYPSKDKGSTVPPRPTSTSADPLGKRVRLTDQQTIALSCADFDKPIYGENPSLMDAQMPNGAQCFNIRAIESLVKRGYLKSDGRGGYLLTREGAEGLRSGMGF